MEKLADVQKKLDDAHKKIKEQQKKIEKMPDLKVDHKRESEAEIAEQAAEMENLKEGRIVIKNKVAGEAKASFQRCLEMVMLLDSKAPLYLLQLNHKAVNGRIMKGGEVIYMPSSLSSQDTAENEDAVDVGNGGPVGEDGATPKNQISPVGEKTME